MNYFEVFDLPVQFRIPQKELNQRYIQLQKQSHPDYFGQADEQQRAEALERSSLINNAYRTFKNEDETIQYVLQIKGLLSEGEAYSLPPDFLMQVMELNEMKMDGARPEAIKQSAQQMQQQIYADVKNILEGYDDRTATDNDLKKVKEYYYKKKYIDRLLAE